MRFHIIVDGRGKLAGAINKQCSKEGISHSIWPDTKDYKKSVILYCGSARQFKDAVVFCRKTNTPMILLSTNIKIPKNISFPFSYVPNASLEVKDFIKVVIDFSKVTKYKKVSILESHQKNKKDISTTAKLIAHKLKKHNSIISSIRDPKKQIQLGIPKKNLNGHAYHKVTFSHDGLQTSFSILVLGRETYAKGAILLAKEIIKSI